MYYIFYTSQLYYYDHGRLSAAHQHFGALKLDCQNKGVLPFPFGLHILPYPPAPVGPYYPNHQLL